MTFYLGVSWILNLNRIAKRSFPTDLIWLKELTLCFWVRKIDFLTQFLNYIYTDRLLCFINNILSLVCIIFSNAKYLYIWNIFDWSRNWTATGLRPLLGFTMDTNIIYTRPYAGIKLYRPRISIAWRKRIKKISIRRLRRVTGQTYKSEDVTTTTRGRGGQPRPAPRPFSRAPYTTAVSLYHAIGSLPAYNGSPGMSFHLRCLLCALQGSECVFRLRR